MLTSHEVYSDYRKLVPEFKKGDFAWEMRWNGPELKICVSPWLLQSTWELEAEIRDCSKEPTNETSSSLGYSQDIFKLDSLLGDYRKERKEELNSLLEKLQSKADEIKISTRRGYSIPFAKPADAYQHAQNSSTPSKWVKAINKMYEAGWQAIVQDYIPNYGGLELGSYQDLSASSQGQGKVAKLISAVSEEAKNLKGETYLAFQMVSKVLSETFSEKTKEHAENAGQAAAYLAVGAVYLVGAAWAAGMIAGGAEHFQNHPILGTAAILFGISAGKGLLKEEGIGVLVGAAFSVPALPYYGLSTAIRGTVDLVKIAAKHLDEAQNNSDLVTLGLKTPPKRHAGLCNTTFDSICISTTDSFYSSPASSASYVYKPTAVARAFRVPG